MASQATADARLNFRLPRKLKRLIEDAATYLGQSVSDFAVSTLVQAARKTIRDHNVTELSNRDRDIFLAMLDDTTIRPNKYLQAAAARYKKTIGRTR